MADAINPWLHILAATIWVGPQFFLFIAAVPAVRTIEDARQRAQVMRVITTRFGYLGWGALAVLVITGIANVYEQDVDLDILFDLNWGIIFQVKMTLLIVVVLLTAVHSFVIGPRMLQMSESVADEAQLASMRRVSMMISGSILLLSLAILFCAALLNSTYALEG
ncbi:MAG: DUF4149 domain-containing protein [Dehalococcoidia bacterium]